MTLWDQKSVKMHNHGVAGSFPLNALHRSASGTQCAVILEDFLKEASYEAELKDQQDPEHLVEMDPLA